MDQQSPAHDPFDEADNRPVTLPAHEHEDVPVIIPADRHAARAKLPPWIIGIAVVTVCCLLFAVAGVLSLIPTGRSAISYFISETPSRTPTPTATFTPRATFTASPNWTATKRVIQTATAQVYLATATTAADNWPILLTDTFASNKNAWWVGDSDDEYGKTIQTIKDGRYSWDVTAEKGFIRRTRLHTEALTDFCLTISAAQGSGPGEADYGVVFREDRLGNLYYFGIGNGRRYALVRLYNDEWSTLLPWTSSSAIKEGEPNRLSVIANGDHFVLFINDRFIAEVQDDKIKEGFTALAIELRSANAHAVFEFHSVELRVPER